MIWTRLTGHQMIDETNWLKEMFSPWQTPCERFAKRIIIKCNFPPHQIAILWMDLHILSCWPARNRNDIEFYCCLKPHEELIDGCLVCEKFVSLHTLCLQSICNLFDTIPTACRFEQRNRNIAWFYRCCCWCARFQWCCCCFFRNNYN